MQVAVSGAARQGVAPGLLRRMFSRVGLLAATAAVLLALTGCNSAATTGGTYSKDQETRMRQAADGVRDPSKMPADIVRARDAANAQMRAHTPVLAPPSPPPAATVGR